MYGMMYVKLTRNLVAMITCERRKGNYESYKLMIDIHQSLALNIYDIYDILTQRFF